MANRRLEEIKLLALCMASDNREAFSRLVEMHQQGLRRFLVNLTGGNVYLAEDLAQETFIKAWMAVRNFHGLSGFRTWLYRIAINEYSSWYRREGRMAYEPVDACRMTPAADMPSALDARMDVARAVEQLPEKEKLVTLLFYLEELQIKDIVKITGMPSGTVKSHLSRARNHLEQYMSDPDRF
ncbi:MAG: RNA polymerase sigma factor [Muribaculaceae bacterium]|nr:RNA polymerase sigma factor [Bacteroidales bacterium]MDY4810700.1 RNA polymerase sigma factor [Muribaculaceae bacterium]